MEIKSMPKETLAEKKVLNRLILRTTKSTAVRFFIIASCALYYTYMKGSIVL